jgi:hypothetical protein
MEGFVGAGRPDCSYLQMFCHLPFTCLYSHLDVPRGGRSRDGSGLSCVDGSGLRGVRSTDGRSSVLSQMSSTRQFMPKSSQTCAFLHFASAILETPNATTNTTNRRMVVFMVLSFCDAQQVILKFPYISTPHRNLPGSSIKLLMVINSAKIY